MTKRVLIIAGEASGDLHGARLLAELRRAQAGGELVVYGLGGEHMLDEGLEAVADVSKISVMGLAEVVRVYIRARNIFNRVIDRVKSEPPDVAVLIDFPEFNLRLAPKLKTLGVKVVYYVSPQVWAWRKGRVKSMARSIDRMLVFFPFEVEFYRGHLDVTHVGHPLVDEVPELEQAWDRDPPVSGQTERQLRLVLLPGSRSNEVRRLLPVMLESARDLRDRYAGLEVSVVRAASTDAAAMKRAIAASGLTVRVVGGRDRFREIASAHLALCTSGTATLEVGLLRTPMVVVYRMGAIGYWLGRLVVKVPFISLVNLVLGKPVVPELIQGQARRDRLVVEAARLLESSEARAEMRAGLGDLRQALGEPGAASRAAAETLAFLEGSAG
ncbi:MAG: lipid-A-disaccharide synthase [Thermoanaerobaculia bacterium]